MKAIFPCKGVVIVTKHNVESIHNFYMDNLINSKLFQVYSGSNFHAQVGSFNYLPQKSTVILENANLLTIQQLHEVLKRENAKDSASNSQAAQNSENTSKNSAEATDYNKPLEDNFILNHPFFETLKPID